MDLKHLGSRALSGVKSWSKGMGQAVKGENAGKVASRAAELLEAQKKRHLIQLGIAGGAGTGLAAITYLKGKSEGMKKHAGFFAKKTVTQKAADAVKGKWTEINKYLSGLSDDTKKHLLKKVKVKRGHLYAAGAGIAAAGAGAGYLAGKGK